MSRYPEGVELLERFKFFTAFYRVSELRSREDLIKLIIENIDYSQEGHSRILLSKALTSSYMVCGSLRVSDFVLNINTRSTSASMPPDI